MSRAWTRWAVAVGVMGTVLLVGSPRVIADEPAGAARPKRIPVEDFTRRPTLSSVSFSPDGKRFAALRSIDGRMNLVTGDLSAKSVTRVTSFTTYDVRRFNWISSNRLVFSLWDATRGLAEQRGGGLVAIDWDGSNPREISPIGEYCAGSQKSCRPVDFLERVPGSEGDIIAVANLRDQDTQDVYRIDTRTGRKTLLSADNPGKVKRWVLDRDHVPRAALSEDGKTFKVAFWYRDSATAPWRKVNEAPALEPHIVPLAFDADGTLFVTSDLASDKARVHVFDPARGRLGDLVADSPEVDLTEAEPIIESTDHRVVGLAFEGYLPQKIWFDERYARMQALLDASLTQGRRNDFRFLDDGRVLVVSYGDRDPGTYYLYDPKAQTLVEQLRPYDWIEPQRMAVMRPFTYRARDGLTVPAYLTLPMGAAPRKLPLVVWVHGGPWARDEWGWNPEVQFLASRGYAVLQPNYRGSEGFGRKHLTSGYRQLGQAMQDDVTDGVRQLVADGTVDASRVCIGGGSYGGYATMMALVKEPEMFRCGINEAGVVDLIWWQELGYTDFNRYDADASDKFLGITVGDVKTDRAMLEQYSPRRHADRIKAPVLIIHGAGDERVPIAHAEGMRDALKAAGKEVEMRVYAEEGHGFVKPANQIDRLQRIEAFLDKHLGR